MNIHVDGAKEMGELRPVWAWVGYDEPNYTYMKDGKKLLTQLAEASPVPIYVRAHNLLTSGDGEAALKWGSTNALHRRRERQAHLRLDDRRPHHRHLHPARDEAAGGDRLHAGSPHHRPAAVPPQLQPGEAIRQRFSPAGPIRPKDYKKWGELVHQWVKHSVQKYGQAEVESWWWEVWNEPNIGYWKGTPEEYQKLYDFAADGLKRALPTARIGGPHSTGPNNPRAQQFLRAFLDHVTKGTNFATGKVGSPIDYIGFHAKGQPRVVDGHVQMGIDKQLSDIDQGFMTVASYPTLKSKPIVIGESDPEGCAACSSRVYKQNNYRNGTMYSSYTAASFARKYDLAAQHGVNFMGAVTWAFEF